MIRRYFYVIFVTAMLFTYIWAFPTFADDESYYEDKQEASVVYIPWGFSAYTEPSFYSELITAFAPQEVIFTKVSDGGWHLINTSYGHLWVNSELNNRYIGQRMAIFDNKTDTNPIAHMPPQVVSIIEEDDAWLLIDTWLGQKWVNLDFSPPTTILDNLLRPHGNNIAVLYKNLDTGFIYTYNPNRIFFGASLNKLNHALYVYTLAERSMINLQHIHTYTAADWRDGTGHIQNMAFGTHFTTQELLRRSIIHSDNVAQHMLIRHTRTQTFTYADFAAEIGANPTFIGNIGSQNTNVSDKLIWTYAVHNYISSDGQFAHLLRADLLAAPGFIIASHPTAQKYGWANASFHDAAIIYAPSPYILIILTNMEDGAGGLFATISRQFANFNTQWFE
ncbi:MAG: class A beta-lactamase-related serine hydrolase [Defluviitaleaceae bacterium]|nr:class A beta-lactamase-related serine hydrolase [Defluviitaleaceae bacterium]